MKSPRISTLFCLSLLILPLLGYSLTRNGGLFLAPKKHVGIFPIYYKVSLSPDDKKILFIYYKKSISDSQNYTSQLCAYNFSDSLTSIIKSSDSAFYTSPYYSNDGNKILYINYEKGNRNIIIYNLKENREQLIFSSPHYIAHALLDSSNSMIYFKADEYLTYHGKKLLGFTAHAIYSINIDGSGLKKLSTNYHSFFGGLSINKKGEELYFDMNSDSLAPNNTFKSNKKYEGPFKLNLKDYLLTPLFPPNMHDLRKEEQLNSGKYTSRGSITPIPTNSNDFVYLFTPTAIYKYYEKKGKAEVFYQLTKEEQKRNDILCEPTIFHTSNKLLLLRVSNNKLSFIILNEEGKIEKSFIPDIVKNTDYHTG